MNAQLTAIIVHDLKNALGALEGELAGLASEPDRERAVHAHASCVELRDRLIGFLTLYKASAQGLTARAEAVSPDDFLRELLRHHATSRPDLRVSIDDRDMPAIAFFDEHLVGLALDAALQNTMRFARTTIEIGCRKNDGGIAFTIQDDGAGLTAKEEKPSTGLGMALCAAIADAHCNETHRGSVALENGAGGGALFTLQLP